MHIRSLFIIALLGMGTVSPALAQAPAVGTDLWKECQSQQSDQALKACTAIIEAKSEPAAKLAQAYNMRASRISAWVGRTRLSPISARPSSS